MHLDIAHVTDWTLEALPVFVVIVSWQASCGAL
jgi:hypothetical protein